MGISRQTAQRLVQLASIGAVFLAWYLANATGLVHPFLLPPLKVVGQSFLEIVAEGDFWPDLRVTLFEYASAFSIAAVVGLTVGFLVCRTNYTIGLFDPVFTSMYSIPLVLLYPLYLLVFGIGSGSKIAIAATIAFFPIVLNAIAGLSTVSRSLIQSAQSMGASQGQLFWQVMLPASFPVVLNGLRIGLIISFLAIIGTETIAGLAGLGRRIAMLAEEMDTPDMFGYIVFVVCVAIIINLVASWIEAAGRRKFQ